MSVLTLRKATREKTKIRIGISGPSGSGKTFSALLLASGMAAWDKIAVIDTENGSADLYAHLGPYNVIRLTAPFSPERYIEAMLACENAGMEVIIVDSATHEWDGKGGCLESNELLGQTKFKGNVWSAWSVTTPRHQRFIGAIVGSDCHIITTARSKTDTIQTEDKKIKKVGMKEIQREGWEYELTINFTLDRDGHFATASKDRTELFSDIDPFKLTADTGRQILEWSRMGVEPTKPVPTTQLIMEHLTACKALQPLQIAFDAAWKYEWSAADAETINTCYLNVYARLSNWLLKGQTEFVSAEGLVLATITRDATTGRVTIDEQKTADQKMADDERHGMQAPESPASTITMPADGLDKPATTGSATPLTGTNTSPHAA